MECVGLLGCLSSPEFYSKDILITELTVHTRGKRAFEKYSKSRDSTIMKMIKGFIIGYLMKAAHVWYRWLTLQGNGKILCHIAHFEDIQINMGFTGGISGKNQPANAGDKGDVGSVPGWGRSPGGRHGNPLQCSSLENLLDRGTQQAIVHGVAKSQTGLKQLSMQMHILTYDFIRSQIFVKSLQLSLFYSVNTENFRNISN